MIVWYRLFAGVLLFFEFFQPDSIRIGSENRRLTSNGIQDTFDLVISSQQSFKVVSSSRTAQAAFLFLAGVAATIVVLLYLTVENSFHKALADEQDDTARLHFEDIAPRAGLEAMNYNGGDTGKRYILESTGSGIALFDFDNDGWLDIFMVNGTRHQGLPPGPPPTNHLYRNNRNLTFVDITQKAGMARTGWGQGVCVGDYDQNGFLDLFVTYYGPNVLYRNTGLGAFEDVTESTRLEGGGQDWSTGCAFLDYDRDGWLDLFVANYLEFDVSQSGEPGSGEFCQWKGVRVFCGPRGFRGQSNRLYRNNGDGTFIDVSPQAGIQVPGVHYGFAVLTADFENRGLTDIYVACDSTPSLLYRNGGDGTFEEVAVMAGCAYNEDGLAQAGMGTAAGDYNSDGYLDIFKTNFFGDTSNLYRNNGNGTFDDRIFHARLGHNVKYLGWGVGFFDFDNDGWKDIFVANGHVYPELEAQGLETPYRERNLLYRNQGNGTFADISRSAGPGLELFRSSRGAAFGDFDNDGDIDIVVNNQNDPPNLLRNLTRNQNNWLLIKTVGTKSNRDGIGARLTVTVGKHRQIDEVRSGGSYLSQSDLRIHFGLGQALQADSIEIRWPSGQTDLLKGVSANQSIVIREGEGIVRAEQFAR